MKKLNVIKIGKKLQSITNKLIPVSDASSRCVKPAASRSLFSVNANCSFAFISKPPFSLSI